MPVVFLEPSTLIKQVDLEWLELVLMLTRLHALNNPERLCGTHPVKNHKNVYNHSQRKIRYPNVIIYNKFFNKQIIIYNKLIRIIYYNYLSMNFFYAKLLFV